MARKPEDTARLYAAFKLLERTLKEDGELPPGFYLDVSGDEVTIKFPKGTVVERDKGTHGDGTILKKAVQNAYGYPTWALMVERLRRFHQWNAIREAMIDAIHEAVTTEGNTREYIRTTYPETVSIMDELQQNLEIPPRIEDTPRICKVTKLAPTITIRKKK